MGGMIVQMMAANPPTPTAIRSLTLMNTHAGDRSSRHGGSALMPGMVNAMPPWSSMLVLSRSFMSRTVDQKLQHVMDLNFGASDSAALDREVEIAGQTLTMRKVCEERLRIRLADSMDIPRRGIVGHLTCVATHKLRKAQAERIRAADYDVVVVNATADLMIDSRCGEHLATLTGARLVTFYDDLGHALMEVVPHRLVRRLGAHWGLELGEC